MVGALRWPVRAVAIELMWFFGGLAATVGLVVVGPVLLTLAGLQKLGKVLWRDA